MSGKLNSGAKEQFLDPLQMAESQASWPILPIFQFVILQVINAKHFKRALVLWLNLLPDPRATRLLQ
jgi:hypothetical protein